ncbi:MAG: cyclic pyranopterin monophosphate synthase MoaC [Terrimicrobiaceae bacterium]
MKNQPVFSHLDAHGKARMVDVSHKPDQVRRAVAEAVLHCLPATLRQIREKALPKGDVMTVAQIAGVLAAKKTSDLIPLCHSLPLSHADVRFRLVRGGIRITAEASTTAKTGVEMEALTAASIAALTLYDMCKAVDKTMMISEIRVVEKTKK